jgi:hypothetical protein
MVAGVNRERRVAALEVKKRARTPVELPMVIAKIGETGDEAVARYVAEHGPLPEVDEGHPNVVVFVSKAMVEARGS